MKHLILASSLLFAVLIGPNLALAGDKVIYQNWTAEMLGPVPTSKPWLE